MIQLDTDTDHNCLTEKMSDSISEIDSTPFNGPTFRCDAPIVCHLFVPYHIDTKISVNESLDNSTNFTVLHV